MSRDLGSPETRRRAGSPAAVPAFLVLFSLLSAAFAPWENSTRGADGPAPISDGPTSAARRHVADVELLGEVRLPSGTTVLGTPLGGLSSITYDSEHAVYYALSDDRGQRAPARFYRLTIDLAGDRIEAGGIAFTGVVSLTNASGQTFDPGSIDPEGLVLAPSGALFLSSEGDASAMPPVAPFVRQFGLDGRQLAELPLPSHYLPDGTGSRGVRNNAAFEPLAASADGKLLLTATENALAQDGPAATLAAGSLSRMVAWDLADRRPSFEIVYPVSPIPIAPNPAGGAADNGLVELVGLSDDLSLLLAMERSYAAGVGTTVRLFEVDRHGATDITGSSTLIDPATGSPIPFVAATKRQVADIGALGARPDNLEGMAFGPPLSDGRQSLILVSDDNFNAQQVTQFVALALRFEAVPERSTIHLPLAIDTELPRFDRH